MRIGGLALTTVIAIAITMPETSACKPRALDAAATSDRHRASPTARGSAEASSANASDASDREDTAAQDIEARAATSVRAALRVSSAPKLTLGPGFPTRGPWVSFYGRAKEMGDLEKVARTYRIINIDADPGAGNFDDRQLATLRAGGNNRILSYFNVGSCEHHRSYWKSAPPPLLSCSQNRAAQRGPYQGYPDETWMDPGDDGYQRLLLEHVAPKLAARVDGFYLDNLEILEHGADASNGPCSDRCRRGGLEFVRKLRAKFPAHLIVMQNATSDVTRTATTGGIAFAALLDGIAHEEVYAPKYDRLAESELRAWRAMGLASSEGHELWIGVEDYVGSCGDRGRARAAMSRARAEGFAPYVSDESAGQRVVCYWD